MIPVRALSLLTLAFVLAPAQQAPLRRTLKEGEKESYSSKLNLKLDADLPNGIGKQDLTVAGDIGYVLEQGKVEGESAVATVTTTVRAFELGGSLSAFLPTPPTPAPIAQKGTLDTRNRLRFEPTKAGDLAAALIASQVNSVSTLLIELPEAALTDGQAWKITIPKGPYTGKEDQFLDGKIIGREDVDGVPTIKVSVTGTINANVDSAAFGGGSVSSKGTATVDGVANIDPATGRTVKLVEKFTTVADVAAGNGIEAKITGAGVIETTLDKPKS